MENKGKLPAAFPEVSHRGGCGRLRPVLPVPWALGRAAPRRCPGSGGGRAAQDARCIPLRWCGARDAACARPFLQSPRPTLLAFSIHTWEEWWGNAPCPGKKVPSPGVCVQINTQCCRRERCLCAAWWRPTASAWGPVPGRMVLPGAVLHGKPVPQAVSRQGSGTAPRTPTQGQAQP